LLVALLSPLHARGQMLFAAHMTQHELLMLVAAPLLVLGRPGVVVFFALPRAEARLVAQTWHRSRLAALTGWATRPLAAWGVHAVALWAWHAPALFEATLRHPLVHDLQHVSFFGSALLFWWALWHGRPGWGGGVAALLYLFTTMVHSGALGALLLFAERPLYPTYGTRSLAWHLPALQDQQLGGLIMWVPAGVVYVFAALLVIVGCLRAAERSTRRIPRTAAG
jgi:putative membrane protein